jgi:hypothetical protein
MGGSTAKDDHQTDMDYGLPQWVFIVMVNDC